MAEIYLVRHGQAAFGSDDYDRLTEIGARQSRWLGEYLRERNLEFGRVFTGTQRRHAETCDGIFSTCGARFERESLPELNEYDFTTLCEAHAGPGALVPETSSVGRNIYRVLHGALHAWSQDSLQGRVEESWETFGRRVGEAYARILAAADTHERVLVICSGGPISRLLATALALPDPTAIGLNLQMINSAFARLFTSDGSCQLAAFNSIPHLDRPGRRDAITYV